MNSSKEIKIKSAYQEHFSSTTDSIMHLRQMLSYRFLSEVEKITDEQNISRKELAAMLGVSASYITQLYRGSKIVNLDILARIEQVLKLSFKIDVVITEPFDNSIKNNLQNQGVITQEMKKQSKVA